MALPRWHVGVWNRFEVRAVCVRIDRSFAALTASSPERVAIRSPGTKPWESIAVENMVRDAGGGGLATGIVSTATRRLAGTPNVCPTIIILSRVVLRHSRDTCAI